MADGGVKNRAKLFEQTPSDPTGPLRKPKPVVTNKPNVFSKPGAASIGKESEETNPFKKFGATTNGGGPVTGPKFKAGLNSALTPKGPKNDDSPDTNNNKSASSGEKDTKEGGPLPKKVLLPPKVSPKNASSAGGDGKPPTPASKPTIGEKPKPQIPAKVPLVPQAEIVKKEVSKADSVGSTSSNCSNSSNSSTPSSANNASEDKGKFDFSKQLRPVVLNGLPSKRTINSIGDESALHSSTSESDASPLSPPPLPKPAPPLPTSPSNVKSQQKNHPVLSQIPKPDVNLAEQLSKLKSRSKSIEKEEPETPVILRESDGKKFRKMTLEKTAHSEKPPEKPTLPKDIDLSTLNKEYEKAVTQGKESCSATPSTNQDEENCKAEDASDIELIYDPGESVPDMRPKKNVQEASRKSDRVSMIPDISPEEEGADGEIPLDEELYTVAESEIPVKNEEPGETEQEKKRRKKEEKERKDREKQEREQEKQRRKKEEEKEKQRKKQEEEEMKRRKMFNLTGKETHVGEGVIKNDVKGGNLNLKVRRGQKVTIVRIDNNPANKWLVKSDTQMGYVDSAQISIDPDIIRQAMTRDKKESAVEEDFDQPTYDAVPEDTSGGGSTQEVEDLEYEDVYEEF